MAIDYDENQIEHITAEDFILNEKDEKKRRKAEKRRRKKYKFSDKKHSRGGIISSIMALAALVFLVLAFVIAIQTRGNGGQSVGIFAGLGFVLSMAGLIIALISFRKTDVFLRYAWVGVFSNGIIWLFICFVIIIGL